MDYLVAKWLHILSSTLLFGTGIGSAFQMLLASLNRQPQAVAVVVRQVVWADWLFTATSIVLQPASGLYLLHVLQLPLTTPWVLWSIALYLLAGGCWLPVVWLQMRMRRLAEAAAAAGEGLPPLYFHYLRWWAALGVPAFVALLAIFWLMVAKPA
ncbi:hypothetical protein CKO44_18625 [Rubrivivax gelatinosus]|uniref:DUF2269 family protein n=1 Tax=Rubrivivax gelatinosus TaxID=28068 RepID=UPI001905FE81|nr:DUF2269 domain-containing protein [Rubrivivax gelatinosus]MBK1615479.1 hypothetical protein [Rubrivivax gelatinosus]